MATTALRISANGLAKLAASMALLSGGAVSSPLPPEVPVGSVPVVAAAVDEAPEELVLRRVGLLMVVFLLMPVPVAAPLAPVPTTPVPIVVLGLLLAIVVVAFALFSAV